MFPLYPTLFWYGGVKPESSLAAVSIRLLHARGGLSSLRVPGLSRPRYETFLLYWEATMPIRDALLPEFDNEMAATRKTLERVPEGKPDWKPHDKSMQLGRLAAHLAELPTWAVMSLSQDSLDLAPPGAAPRVPAVMTSRRELLDTFDKNVASARAAIAAASDESLIQPWTLLKGGQKIMSLPRVAVVRNFVLNHTIHHRAQLGVYLRLNDIPVPSIYGPSADEAAF